MTLNNKESEIFSKNIKALAEFHPHVCDCLDTVPPFQIDVKPSGSGTLNLIVRNKAGDTLTIYPPDNPVKDIPGILDQLSKTRGRIICLLGFGLGYHAEKIIEHIGAVNIVVLYEAHPAILKEAMQHSDLTRIFSHRHVRMVVGNPAALSSLLKSERDILFAGNKHILVETKKITALSPEWYEAEKVRIQRFVQGVIISNSDMATNGKRYFENRFKNLFAMSESIPLGRLENRFAGKPAIIVASGPSLSKNIEQLKSAKGKAIILAADSAVAPLLAHGIKPDIVVSVDINDFTFEKLAPFADRLQETGLLFIPEVTPKVPNYINFAFKIFTLLSPYSAAMLNELLGTDEQPIVHAQSVVHLALGAAQRMGCEPIIFTGLDLAYDREKDHADGTVLHWGNRQTGSLETDLMVESIHGEMIPTNVGLNILEPCRKLIESVPRRTYIDATEGGALIYGTRIRKLAETLAEHCVQPVNTASVSSMVGDREGSRNLCSGLEAIKENGHATIAALSDILAVDHDRYAQLEIQKAEAESSGDARAMATAVLRQQKFIQSARAIALSHLLEEADRLVVFFREIERFSKILDGNGDHNEADISALAHCLFKKDLLAKAVAVSERLPLTAPIRRFYAGVLKVKCGDVRNGLQLMDDAVNEDPDLGARKQGIVDQLEGEWVNEGDPIAVRQIRLRKVLTLKPDSPPVLELWNSKVKLIELNLASPIATSSQIVAVEQLLSQWEPLKDLLPAWHKLSMRCLAAKRAMMAQESKQDGDDNHALTLIEEALSIEPDNAFWLMFQANVLFGGDRYEEGMTSLRKAVANGNHPWWDAQLAYLHMRFGRHREGVEQICSALKRMPGAGVLLRLSDLFLTSGETGGGADRIEETMPFRPFVGWLVFISRLLLETGDLENGAVMLTEAAMLDSRVAYLWEELGDMFTNSGQMEDAVCAYERCCMALPERLSAMRKIGDSYCRLGKLEAAKVAYTAALAARR